MRRITVAATPYGRLATIFAGAGASAARSTSSASAKCSDDVVGAGDGRRQPLTQALVELDHVHEPGARGQPLAEDPGAAADLEHDVV